MFFAESEINLKRKIVVSACPKNIFFSAGNNFSLFTDVKICEKSY